MSATDGAFDANVESVTGTIDTTSLTLGRHIVYVVGELMLMKMKERTLPYFSKSLVVQIQL